MAQRVAAEVAGTAVERDRAGVPPRAEIERLRASGLLTLLVPVACGGAGQRWGVAQRVVRVVGAADASIGHLLGYHYLQLWRVGLGAEPGRRRRITAASAAGRWFWAGASNPRDDPLRLAPAPGGGLRLDGRKGFATGARLADRLIVTAVRDDTGHAVTFALAGDAPGVTHLDDWDNLGQRSSASGSVVFDAVPVDGDDVLHERPDGEPEPPGRRSLPQLGFQLVLTHLYVALAEGALAAAAAYVRTRSRPWPAGGAGSAAADPHVRAGFGELVARTAGAAALADRATEVFEAADDAGEALGPDLRGEAAVAVARAKVVATGVATDVTSGIFELAGARATAARYGLDRYWRDARTLTLHDPVAYKAEEVGAHHLTGAYPPVTGYS